MSREIQQPLNPDWDVSDTESLVDPDYIVDPDYTVDPDDPYTTHAFDNMVDADLEIDHPGWEMTEEETIQYEEQVRVIPRPGPRPNNAFTAEYNFFDPNYEIKRQPLSDEKLGHILDYNDRVLEENPEEKKLIKRPAECIFCIEHITQWLVIPNCKHAFHASCLLEWFKHGKTCPLCRKS